MLEPNCFNWCYKILFKNGVMYNDFYMGTPKFQIADHQRVGFSRQRRLGNT